MCAWPWRRSSGGGLGRCLITEDFSTSWCCMAWLSSRLTETFRALSDQFYRTREHHRFVRQQVVNQPYVQEAERISSCSSLEEGSNVWVFLKDVGHYLKVQVVMLTVVERFVDWAVSWLPMYGEAKLLLGIYLWYPSTWGAGHVYDGFLHPLVAWHEADIDRGLLELRARARDMKASQLKAAAAIGQMWLVDAARCVSSQLQAARSGREGATH
ncbi:uncharacterized protein [Aegilops tauschii subsp. strangulata]|uniref:uncharacterized protein isoform X1 n=1 Tax=Aegilops tauschii subsp. strangulata TaxID=200361 RepID=UPI001ABCA4AA